MSCEMEPKVSLLIDGELADAERVDVEAHLKHCAACRQVRRDFLHLSETIRSHRVEPRGSTSDALDALLSTAHGGFWKRRVSVPLPLATAATVTVLVLGAWAALQQLTPAAPAVPADVTLATSDAEVNLLDRYDGGLPAVLYKVRRDDR